MTFGGAEDECKMLIVCTDTFSPVLGRLVFGKCSLVMNNVLTYVYVGSIVPTCNEEIMLQL